MERDKEGEIGDCGALPMLEECEAALATIPHRTQPGWTAVMTGGPKLSLRACARVDSKGELEDDACRVVAYWIGAWWKEVDTARRPSTTREPDDMVCGPSIPCMMGVETSLAGSI